MIDLMQEQLVPVRDVPKLLPPRPNGRPLHLSACYRWMEKGIKGTKLEAVRIGGTTYTSKEALQRFANHLSQTSNPCRTDIRNPGESVRRAVPEPVARRAELIFGSRRPTPKRESLLHGERSAAANGTSNDALRERRIA